MEHHRIYFHKRLKKWMVNIRFNNENVHIGYYPSLQEAIDARNEALASLKGSMLEVLKEASDKKKRLPKFQQLLKKAREDALSKEDRELLDKVKEIENKPGIMDFI